MPSRILRDGIIDSKRIGRMSEGAQLLYYKLLSIVDDFGRYEADPELLIVRLFPWAQSLYSVSEIRKRLDECSSGPRPLIVVYASNGNTYLEIQDERRKPRAVQSKYPNPDVESNGIQEIPEVSVGKQQTSPNTNTETNTPSLLDSSLKEINTPPVERETPLGPVRVAPKSSRTPSPEEIDVFSNTVEDVVATYPNPRDSGPSRLALVARFSGTEKADDLTLFLTNLALFKQTRSWRDKNGAFVPKLWDFVESGRWKHPPIRDEPTDRTSEKLARLDRVLGGGEKHASQ